LPQGMLATTCAPRGIGKDPSGAPTRTVAPESAEADAVCDGDAAGDVAGDDWLWLTVGEGDVTGFALVIPALHAARDRPTAQDVTVMAIKRYWFIKCLSVGLVAPGSKLSRHLATGIAVLSRFCDSGRSSGTSLHWKPDADHRALAVPAANRDLPAVTDDNDPDQGEADTRTRKAARGPASGELLPDLPDLVLRDPGPGVGHL